MLNAYDHGLLEAYKVKTVWTDMSKFCTGEPNPVPKGRWVCAFL